MAKWRSERKCLEEIGSIHVRFTRSSKKMLPIISGMRRLFADLNLEPIENAYGTSRYNSGLLRVAFVRGNENLKSKSGEPIDGSRLSGGGVLVSREKWRDLWMAVTIQSIKKIKFWFVNEFFLRLIAQNTTQQSHFGEEFHTYELLWTNRSIELSVDGNPYGSIEGGFRNLARTNNVSVSSQLYAGEYMAPFDKEVRIWAKNHGHFWP